jgi:hypothetical protein
MTATTLAAPKVTTEIIPFTAADGMPLNLHHVVADTPAPKGPILLVHGAGVRADIFRAPEPVNVVTALVSDGWDVWLENWRASIDLPPNPWNLDQAAVYDHPVAVSTVLERTGTDRLKAIIHCQGSSSFMLSAVSGLLPQVELIISNAMSLHPVIPSFSRFKIARVAPVIASVYPYVDPRWGGARPPALADRLMASTVGLTHRECTNGVCKMVSFTYGAGHPALWSHENLSPRTHEWLRHEFGSVPMTFFAQMASSVAAGRIMPTGTVPGLPSDPVSGAPATDARVVLLAGQDNRCFLPESQVRTHQYFVRHRPHRGDTLHLLPGYGHLDVFMGRYAARDTIPLILQELSS